MAALAGKVALVTGSSRGIGAAIAARFASEGATLVLHSRDPSMLSRPRDELASAGGRVITVTGDVTRLADIEQMRAQIEEEVGPVDVLVTNAGNTFAKDGPVIAAPGSVEDATEAAWHAILDANLTATFLTIKGFLPGMKARRAGNIITLSSVAGRRPHARAPIAYAVAKVGIQLLTQNVAEQAAPYGVRANCLAPATILTERNDTLMSAEQKSQLTAVYPLNRLGTVQDVANAALFLASDQSAWITGIVLDVAGGLVMNR